MKHILLALALILANLFASSFAIAASSLAADWEKISPNEFNLPPPPDAAASALEISELLELQAVRTTAECDLGEKQSSTDFAVLFADTPLLSKKDIIALSPLLTRVKKVGENISHGFKDLYKRSRPFIFDSRVQPCVQLPRGPNSYPSSHALLSTLESCVLGLILPSSQREFSILATELSERRMKIGVHFPSDVRAGEKLGVEICSQLAQDHDFQSEVDSVRRAL